MNGVRIAAATARTEAAAILRRPGVVVVIAVLAAFPVLTYHHLFDGGAAEAVGRQAYFLNTFAPAAVGVAFADRFVRDRILGVRDILDATPASAAARVWGRFAGLIAAATVPLLAVWVAAAVRIAIVTHAPAALTMAAVSFAAAVLPGLAMVCGLALAGPALTGPALFRVLFICYWFWGNLLPSALFPSPSSTWVTPIGGVALTGIFHVDLGYGHVTATDAAASVTSVAIIGVLLAGVLAYAEHRRQFAA